MNEELKLEDAEIAPAPWHITPVAFSDPFITDANHRPVHYTREVLERIVDAVNRVDELGKAILGKPPMSEQFDTFPRLLALMRSDPLYNPHNDPSLVEANKTLRHYADRLDAVYKRKVESEKRWANHYFEQAQEAKKFLAELLYYTVEDYDEDIASTAFVGCVKDSCATLGISYSPHGRDMAVPVQEYLNDSYAKPKKFDEAAFDAAVSKPNGWSEVQDPVAEVRRMRGDEPQGNAAAMHEALLSVRKPIAYRGGDLARYTLPVIDAALKTPPEPAGNAAMMLMAIEVLWDVIGQFSNNILDGQMQLVLSDMLIPAKNAYHRALAAPPRNCDVGTADEQMRRYCKFTLRYNPCSYEGYARCAEDCPIHKKLTQEGHGELLCQLEWAQMPYEAEGGCNA